MSSNKQKLSFICETILHPGGEAKANIEPAKRPVQLTGSTIILFDNFKSNANVILETVKEKMEDFGVNKFIYVKLPFENSIDEKNLKKMLKADAAIMAVGSCGSCTYRLTLNTLELERRGIPTIQIETDVFASQCADMLKSYGAEHIPIIVIKHPIEKLTKSEVKTMVLGIFDQIVDALTKPTEIVKKRYGAEKWLSREHDYII